MKSCPYCNGKIPEKEPVCPRCGKEYWQPEQEEIAASEKLEEEAEMAGCLSLLLLPFVIALASTLLLIGVGFLLHLLVHFESNQIKITWVGASLALGLIIYRCLSKKRKLKTTNFDKI